MSKTFRSDRRAALTTLSSMLLLGCGGGTDGAAPADTQLPAGIETQPQAQVQDGGTTAPSSQAAPATAPAPASAPAPAPAPAPSPKATQKAAQDPAPEPAPKQAPTPTTEPISDGSVQYLTWDGGSGPSRDHWSEHLGLRWKNPNTGDWTDAAGKAQGAVPFSSIAVPAAGLDYGFDATELVRRWLRTGQNKGFMLRVTGRDSPSATWSGRRSAHPPRLAVTLADGRVVECACLAFAGFSPTSSSARDTRLLVRTGSQDPGILQFDLSGLGKELQSAIVTLRCESKFSAVATLESFECDPPQFRLGAGGAKPTLGLSAELGELNLRGHPDVIRAGDFSDLSTGVLFDGLTLDPNSANEQLPDPDAPGSVLFRGSFTPLARGSFSGKIETMRASYGDPLRPPARVTNELFCRLYFFLEDDWLSTRDANKMAIGWDLRMGWWNNAGGGYWQSTRGNGGAPGTGLKMLAPAKKNGSSQFADTWEYQGHSIRMEAGKGVDDGNPYSALRPVQDYIYSLDQPGSFGQMFRLGNAVLGRGRWHCIEQQIKINSVVGPFDALGNGQAVNDGVLRTWLDGVPVSEVLGLRWRRHPDMGVQGPWINWYYGGKQATERTMHYRMNHLVLARRYIGPRKL